MSRGTSPFRVGDEVEVSIRSAPDLAPRVGTVKQVRRSGEFYVTDGRSFGHWYGGPGEKDMTSADGDSVFLVRHLA